VKSWDMIEKFKEGKDHVPTMRKLFKRLRRYQLKLNPSKYTFRVNSRNVLEFIMSNMGIEVDHDKVKTVQVIPTHTIKKRSSKFSYMPKLYNLTLSFN
jgi:hypothetical protein